MSAASFPSLLLNGFIGDDETAEQLSAEAEIAAMLRFEIALARAEGAMRVIPAAAAKAIVAALRSFKPNAKAIARATAKDGVVGVEFVRLLRQHVGAPHGEFVHFGATSQDVVDTGLALRLHAMLQVFEQRLTALIDALEHLSARYGARKLIGRTRMQDAIPITVGARVEAWSLPLARDLERLRELRPRVLLLQFGGAAGTLEKLGNKGRDVSTRMAKELGLGAPARNWHTQRDGVAELGNWLSLVSGTLGKIGTDVTLMAQNAVGEIKLSGTGGSSAMAHKQNPVKAEVLVALARYNAALLGGLHQGLVHEQERSGAAWTLEWLVLPQMLMTTGAGLRNAIELAGSVKAMGVGHG